MTSMMEQRASRYAAPAEGMVGAVGEALGQVCGDPGGAGMARTKSRPRSRREVHRAPITDGLVTEIAYQADIGGQTATVSTRLSEIGSAGSVEAPTEGT